MLPCNSSFWIQIVVLLSSLYCIKVYLFHTLGKSVDDSESFVFELETGRMFQWKEGRIRQIRVVICL